MHKMFHHPALRKPLEIFSPDTVWTFQRDAVEAGSRYG